MKTRVTDGRTEKKASPLGHSSALAVLSVRHEKGNERMHSVTRPERYRGQLPSVGARLRTSFVLFVVWAATISLPRFSERTALADEPLPMPRGPRLKALVPNDGSVPLCIGGTIGYRQLGTSAETIFVREFEFLTPANAFKQTTIHPEPGKWRWRKADAFVEYCAKHNYVMRLHAAVSPQCSAWAEEDHRTSEELLKNLEEYVTAVCKRYNGRPHVRWMDVVNETVTRDGKWFGPKPGVGKWQNPWTQIGFDETHPLRPPLYIKRAFELANKHAPNIKLLINQHGGMEPPMWDKVKRIVLYLREKGIRIDGIGWQGHVDTGWEKDPDNLRRLNELITWAHRHKLEFHVTENTVWMRRENANNAEGQAATFAAIVRTLLEHAEEGVVTWNAWQMRDSDTQRAEFRGTLFDSAGRPKPSYYAVQRELAAWASRWNQTSHQRTAAATTTRVAAKAPRPNIVLVLADDLGWTGLGCYGSEFYETPQIDRLASQGVRFTAAFSAGATCAPSRASIMTGLYTPAHR
ncbi:MAG TPA: hypothetical protein ENJ50_02540, partial [Planctomycetaceae bacterium]|nr:hypothetical protein [Planctomycetaceae bacterium]